MFGEILLGIGIGFLIVYLLILFVMSDYFYDFITSGLGSRSRGWATFINENTKPTDECVYVINNI